MRAYLAETHELPVAVQGLLPDAHVPVRAPAGGPLPRAPAVRHRGVRRGRTRRRRRGDRGRRRVPARASGSPGSSSQLNSIGDEVCRPAYREELHRLPRAQPGPPDATSTATGSRTTRCGSSTARTTPAARSRPRRRRSPTACASRARALRRRPGGPEGRRARVRSLEPTLVRGLDYYTRTAFEFVSPGLSPQQGTLFGGGRYDGLAEVLGGPHVPGVGFGMGLERVLLALEQEGLDAARGAGARGVRRRRRRRRPRPGARARPGAPRGRRRGRHRRSRTGR